jgi:hypothetical protein
MVIFSVIPSFVRPELKFQGTNLHIFGLVAEIVTQRGFKLETESLTRKIHQTEKGSTCHFCILTCAAY